jgi:large subunit ribosomal protein L23
MDSFIIKKPWVTEKATGIGAHRQYIFLVQQSATKPEVKKAVKELYKVDVTAVNIVNLPAKHKRYRGVKRGSDVGRKKAIVTLKEGQKIDLA